MFVVLFGINHILDYLTLKFKMTLNHESNTKNEYFSQNYTKKRYYIIILMSTACVTGGHTFRETS